MKQLNSLGSLTGSTTSYNHFVDARRVKYFKFIKLAFIGGFKTRRNMICVQNELPGLKRSRKNKDIENQANEDEANKTIESCQILLPNCCSSPRTT